MDFTGTNHLATDRQTLSQANASRTARSLFSALRLTLAALALALVMHVGHGTAQAQTTSLICRLLPVLCQAITPPPSPGPVTAVPELDPGAGAGAFALLIGGAAVLLGGRRRRA